MSPLPDYADGPHRAGAAVTGREAHCVQTQKTLPKGSPSALIDSDLLTERHAPLRDACFLSPSPCFNNPSVYPTLVTDSRQMLQ